METLGRETDPQVVERLLRQRYSCRSFRENPVPRETIEAVLASAQRTGSWCNVQPWAVVVTSGNATDRVRTALHAAAAASEKATMELPPPAEYRGIYLDRRRAAGFGLYAALGIARDDRAARERQMLENYRMFRAPHLALISSPRELGTYGAIDCGAYIANFLLAATAHGLGTIAMASITRYPAILRGALPVPESHNLVAGIAFGYACGDAPANAFRTDREDVAGAVEWVEI